MENNDNKQNSNNYQSKGVLKDEYENKYEGEIINDQANGKGTKIYKDGRIYTGEFKNNKRNGYGVLIRPDGTKFKEKYREDL